MTNNLHPAVATALAEHELEFECIECDPALADTADFCAHYGYRPDQSANTLLVGSTKGEPRHAVCVVLATCRLDVNKVVRKKLGVRRISFADPDITRELTGMELGGVTPFALPESLPLWVDAAVMQCDQIILGGGNRLTKLIMSPQQLLKLPGLEVVDSLAYLHPPTPTTPDPEA